MLRFQGGGNVFADLGLPDAEELLVKARLASAITEIIKERRLTQAGAAKVQETRPPHGKPGLR